MPEKKQEITIDNFMEGFKKEDIENSANLNIKPKLEILGLGIVNGIEVEVLSEPYKVQLPKGKGLSKDDKIWVIDVMYMDVEHQFICQAGSFRYQLLVLVKKYFKGEMAVIIGERIKIWKERVVLDKWGESELYKVELIQY